jgi:flagellar biosynthesis protein FliQ
MFNLPPAVLEFWQAITKLTDKLAAFVYKILTFLWGIFVWLFEKLTELIKFISDKI